MSIFFIIFNDIRRISFSCFSVVEVICKGQAAHECILLENTAGDKLYYMLDQFARLRKQEVEKLKMDSKLTLGDVTTVNLTLIKGGVKPNVVPAELGFTVDIFLVIDVDPDDFEKQVRYIFDKTIVFNAIILDFCID